MARTAPVWVGAHIVFSRSHLRWRRHDGDVIAIGGCNSNVVELTELLEQSLAGRKPTASTARAEPRSD